MSRAKAQTQPAVTGSMFLVLVGLGMAFLIFTAFLNVVKGTAPLFNESNMLYLALIFYAGAGALYMGYGVTGIERYVKVASVVTILGFIANTLAAGHRWYVAGRPPFSNLYEMLLSFVWTVAILTIFVERLYKVKIIGSVTMPLAVVSVILMQLMPSEVQPLVPALQSTWLHIHVSLAMLSYAACAVSFALAMMFLIQDKMQTETFQALTSAGMVGIFASILMNRFQNGGLNVIGWDAAAKEEIFIARGQRLFVTIPDLGWLFALVLLSALIPFLMYVVGKVNQGFDFRIKFFSWELVKFRVQAGDPEKASQFFSFANRGMFVTILLQVVALVVFAMRAKTGAYPAATPEIQQLTPTALAASPFILSGVIGSIFAGLLFLLLLWRRAGLESMLPSTDTLDRLTYRTVAVAFPLLTAMIATGAYWANQTWGSYWSWDPKETWAAITWLVYAGYLHMRITRGWRGRRAAYFAIVGFIVVIFTFFGVTYLLPSIHGYASM